MSGLTQWTSPDWSDFARHGDPARWMPFADAADLLANRAEVARDHSPHPEVTAHLDRTIRDLRALARRARSGEEQYE